MHRLYRVDPRGELTPYRLTPHQNPFAWGCVGSLLVAFALTSTISILLYILQGANILQGVAFSVLTMGALVSGLILLVMVPLHIGEYYGSKRTVESIESFEIAVSDAQVTIGHPFTVTYTLSFKRFTWVKRVRLTCDCHFDWGEDADHPGSAPDFRRLIRIATYRAIRPRDRVKGEPGSPLVHTFSWTLPAKHLPRRASFVHEHKAWHLHVYITAHRGWPMRGSFVMPVHIPAGA